MDRCRRMDPPLDDVDSEVSVPSPERASGRREGGSQPPPTFLARYLLHLPFLFPPNRTHPIAKSRLPSVASPSAACPSLFEHATRLALLDMDMDPEMAAMMGFGGFGKKAPPKKVDNAAKIDKTKRTGVRVVLPS